MRLGDKLEKPKADVGISALIQADPMTAKREALEGRRESVRKKYDDLMVSMRGLMEKKAIESPVLPEQGRIPREEMLTAAVTALLGQALGARNAGQAFQQYTGNREQDMAQAYKQELARSEMDYNMSQQLADAQLASMKAQGDMWKGDLTGIGTELGDLAKLEREALTQSELSKRNAGQTASKEGIAKMQDDTRRFIAGIQSSTTRDKDFNAIAGQYAALREIGFDDDTARRMVSAQFDLKSAQAASATASAGLSNERAETERKARAVKIEEIRSKIGANNARAKHTLAAMELLDDKVAIDQFKAAAGMFQDARDFDNDAANGLVESLTKEWSESKKYMRSLEADIAKADEGAKASLTTLLEAEKKRYRAINDALYEAKTALKKAQDSAPMSPPFDPTKLPNFPAGIAKKGTGAPPKGKIGK